MKRYSLRLHPWGVNIKFAEKIIIVLVIFIAIFLAKFPTLYHYLNTPQGYWFVGHASWFDAWDINVYLSYMRFGERTGMLLENVYTTISHNGVFIYQFYTIFGVINRSLGLPPPLFYQIVSVLVGAAMIISSYFVVSSFIKDRLIKLVAIVIIVLGGGFGWAVPIGSSLDLTGAGFTLAYGLEIPHQGLSILLFILSITSLIMFTIKKKRRYLFAGVITGFLHTMIHPPFILLYLALSLPITFIMYVSSKKKIFFLYPIFLIFLFGLYYFAGLKGLTTNPGFLGLVDQQLPHATLQSLLLGFGVLLPFLLWNLFYLFDKRLDFFFIKFIFIVQTVFLFLPLGYTLFFLKGIFVWGTIIALDGVQNFVKQKKAVLLTIILVFSVISRFYVFDKLINIDKENSFFFLKTEEGNAISYLSSLPSDSGVLSLYRIGNHIPAHTNNRVYYGHGFQTPNAEEKLEKARRFYVLMDEKEQREFVRENNIDYIYYGLEEQNLREINEEPTENPFPYFKAVHDQDRIIVYKVN